jgi:hypothetical protein
LSVVVRQAGLQALIEDELTEVIVAARHERTHTGQTCATGIALRPVVDARRGVRTFFKGSV